MHTDHGHQSDGLQLQQPAGQALQHNARQAARTGTRNSTHTYTSTPAAARAAAHAGQENNTQQQAPWLAVTLASCPTTHPAPLACMHAARQDQRGAWRAAMLATWDGAQLANVTTAARAKTCSVIILYKYILVLNM